MPVAIFNSIKKAALRQLEKKYFHMEVKTSFLRKRLFVHFCCFTD